MRKGLGIGLVLAATALPAVCFAQSEPFRVTVNHAEALQLGSAAAVALIANPDIADIVNEQHNLIFVIGRKPGVTNILVYDENGNRLVGRDIEVVPEQGGMVTVTRETDVTDYYCEPHCVFYAHEQGGSPPTPTPTAAPNQNQQNQNQQAQGAPPPATPPGTGVGARPNY